MAKSFFITAFLLIIGNYNFLTAQSSTKIDPSLLASYQQKEVLEYIILLKDRTVFEKPLPFETKTQKARFVFEKLVHKALTSQKEIIQILKKKGISFRSFYVTNAIKITSDYEMMLSLANRADVSLVIDDAPLKMLDYVDEKVINSSRNPEPEWGIKYIKADSVWQQGIRGQGVIIGGQDTGYSWDVSPIRSKYKGYIDSTKVIHDYSWHDAIAKNNPKFPDSLLNPCGYSTRQPCDDNNHGTHTMGTMVGEDSTNIIGVAPEAKWIACRNMDRGWGQPSTYIECFEWFLAPYDLDGKNPDPDQAPHVINNSWYCSEEEGCNPSNFVLMEEIVKNLKASGVVVVVSAGNTGNKGCGSVTGPPALFESSFSVGATDINGNIAGFSSLGPVLIDSSYRLKPNVSAPGVNVRSVTRNGNFANYSGTSMAGPHIAGLVALIISANPDLAGRVEAIENIIEATAIPKVSERDCGDFLGAVVPNAVFGFGIGNALDAVAKAKAYTTNIIDATSEILTVSPNPTSEFLNFSIHSKITGITKISLYSLNNQVVMQKRYDTNYFSVTLDVSALPKGIYLYKVEADGKSWYGKIVIF